jgi:enamine deaminase RidA (YjgF/YER057c/UK114 family)
MTSTPSARVFERLVVRQVPHPTHVEWYLTGRPDPDSDSLDESKRVFSALADVLAAQNIVPFAEKIYGVRTSHASLLGHRTESLAKYRLAPDWPVTIVEGAPASGAEFGGVQLWGITPRPESGQRVETIVGPGGIRGREWIGPDFRELVLAALGSDVRDDDVASAPDHARRMFEAASAALSERGYSFRQVARTWIYLSRILGWYGEFNRVRTAHYAGAGLGADAAFPASTGIEGRHDREPCLMDLLAVDARAGSGLVVRPVLESDRQGQPFAYGSAFARAMVLERNARKIIHVSGTASIGADGRSRHVGDASAQFSETLLGIAAVLEREGGCLSDIGQATLFAKSPAVAATCREVSRRLCLPALPFVEIVADVCRPELLVEVEAVALL